MTDPDRPRRDESTVCDGCDGSGVRDPAGPDCVLQIPPGWHVVERCDACAQFASDEEAARHRHGAHVRVVACADGGAHVIVPDRPAPGRRARSSLRLLIHRVVAALDRVGRS